MKLCVLGSGSEGNATLLYTDKSALLLDAGFSARELERRMKSAGFDPARLDALLLTHEHADHIRGAGVMAKKYRLPVYATNGTSLNCNGALDKNKVEIQTVKDELPFEVGDMEIEPFSIPHDAAEPVAFSVSHNQRRAVVLTDLGSVTVKAVEKVRRANLAVLESNHDPELLQIGPYPWPLKQRIAGALGHLSNGECLELLEFAGGDGLSTVIFAHISRTNNNPDLVRVSADEFFNGNKVRYEIARQDAAGAIFEV